MRTILQILFFLKLYPLCRILIRKEIKEDEDICRFLFFPDYIDKKSRIKANAFKPDPGTEEVSTSRAKYASLKLLFQLALKIKRRNSDFKGIASIKTKQIYSAGAEVKYSPLKENVFHSDILMGLKSVKGEPMSAELQERAKLIASNCLFIEYKA